MTKIRQCELKKDAILINEYYDSDSGGNKKRGRRVYDSIKMFLIKYNGFIRIPGGVKTLEKLKQYKHRYTCYCNTIPCCKI